MNLWGERYAEVSLFVGHCRDLNVKTDESELERYEKIGAMLPVARVVYPIDLVTQRDQSLRGVDLDQDERAKWPALGRLTEGIGPFPYGYDLLTNEELVHCVDREMEIGNNPHLMRPKENNFRPWANFRTEVVDRYGNVFSRPTAEHYYSYWQVHQLTRIQQYPDLFDNAWLIDRMPMEDPMRHMYPRAPNVDLLSDFFGMRQGFDALSYWAILYERERGRTFATVPERSGVRSLDDTEVAAYRKRLVELAIKVATRFNLARQELYGFLREVINLLERYEREERYKLAEELKKDIHAWEDLLRLNTGEKREEVGEELGKVNIHDRKTYRHLNASTKERDYALNVLLHTSKFCVKDLCELGEPSWEFTEADADALLSYCEQRGLGLFATALSGMVAIGEQEHQWKFTRVQMYTNLKNVLTSFEYLLKELAGGSGYIKGDETLTWAIGKVMAQEKWFPQFQKRSSDRSTSLIRGKSSQDFLANLVELLSDSQLSQSLDGYWAQKFLVTCLARNMAVHSYPNEDQCYGDLFGPMLNSVIAATFYMWRLAKRKGWTKQQD